MRTRQPLQSILKSMIFRFLSQTKNGKYILRLRLIWGITRSLQFRIAWGAILAVALSSLTADTVIYLTTAQQVRDRTIASLTRSNYLLSFAVAHWRQEIFKSLELLSLDQSFRNLNTEAMADTLKALRLSEPNRQISVWSPDGRLIISGGTEPGKGLRNGHVFRNPAFQEALKGNTTLQVLGADGATKSCLFAASAIYPEGVIDKTEITAPKAIVTLCAPFFLAEDDAGLAYSIEKTDSPESGAKQQELISMESQNYNGSEFMMVRNNGYVVFPLTSINDWISSLSPAEIRRSPWGPFVDFALSGKPDNQGLELVASGKTFIVVKRWLPDRHWVVLSIVSRDTALRGLNLALRKLRAFQVVTMLIVALVLIRISGEIVKPIRKASQAIRKISQGDFKIHVEDQRDDEIGELYKDINATGNLLSSFVAREKGHAVAEQQIATAQQIQQSFLLKSLPESDFFEIAADSLPAYEVGADWYDSLKVGHFLYVIVADVCDKGVPSALFMSVFRSLLRSNILTQAREAGLGQPADLAHATRLVNEYMSENHGSTCMFATIFAACYDTQTGQLTYVNAGHESPLVLRNLDTEAKLESLDPTGPAVGLFPGAQFLNSTTTLAPGDLLFTFTDGLTDARSPAEQGWGIQRLQDFLLQLQSDARHPAAVLQQVFKLIENHQGSAERFDDLTVLLLRVTATEPVAADTTIDMKA
jgi:serine phosphatase RsbU (regulator of sigma subunit)